MLAKVRILLGSGAWQGEYQTMPLGQHKWFGANNSDRGHKNPAVSWQLERRCQHSSKPCPMPLFWQFRWAENLNFYSMPHHNITYHCCPTFNVCTQFAPMHAMRVASICVMGVMGHGSFMLEPCLISVIAVPLDLCGLWVLLREQRLAGDCEPAALA